MIDMFQKSARTSAVAILVAMIIVTGVCIYDLFFPGRRIPSSIMLLILWGPRVAFLLISRKKSRPGTTEKKPEN
jgi:hypothetical protein